MEIVVENCQIIWTGIIEWHEKIKVEGSQNVQKMTRQIPCQASVKFVGPNPPVLGYGWPQNLAMQLVSKGIFKILFEAGYFPKVRTLLFTFPHCEIVSSLALLMNSGLGGFVVFPTTGKQTSPSNIRSLILLYWKERDSFFGFIPMDQARFVEGVRVLHELSIQEAMMRLGNPSVEIVPRQGIGQQHLRNIDAVVNNRKRLIIWAGILDWHEKLKGQPESLRITRQIACQVYSNFKGTELEVTADGWPSNLGLHLVPKAVLRGICDSGQLMSCKTVLFTLENCEALIPLTRLMDSGLAGYVHFRGTPQSSACNVRVLLLIYSPERNAFIGFIMNDQAAAVNLIRKGIQVYKAQQATMLQEEELSQAMPHQPGPSQVMLQQTRHSQRMFQQPGPSQTMIQDLEPNQRMFQEHRLSSEMFQEQGPSQCLYQGTRQSYEMLQEPGPSQRLYHGTEQSYEMFQERGPSQRLHQGTGQSYEMFQERGPSQRLCQSTGQSCEIFQEPGPSQKLFRRLGQNQGSFQEQGLSQRLYEGTGQSQQLFQGPEQRQELGPSQEMFNEPGPSQRLYQELGQSQEFFNEPGPSQRLYQELGQSQEFFNEPVPNQRLYQEMGQSQEFFNEPGSNQRLYQELEQSQDMFHEAGFNQRLYQELGQNKEMFNEPEPSRRLYHSMEQILEVFPEPRMSQEIFHDPRMSQEMLQGPGTSTRIFQEPGQGQGLYRVPGDIQRLFQEPRQNQEPGPSQPFCQEMRQNEEIFHEPTPSQRLYQRTEQIQGIYQDPRMSLEMIQDRGPSQGIRQQGIFEEPHSSYQMAQASAPPLLSLNGNFETVHSLAMLLEQNLTFNPLADVLTQQLQTQMQHYNYSVGGSEPEANTRQPEIENIDFGMSLMEL